MTLIIIKSPFKLYYFILAVALEKEFISLSNGYKPPPPKKNPKSRRLQISFFYDTLYMYHIHLSSSENVIL